MRVAIVADAERLAEEHAGHARMCVGLLDAGLGVIRLVPESFDRQRSDPREAPLTLIPRVAFEPTVAPWLRGWRRSRLLDALERTAPDVLFATGSHAWDVALDLGAALERPVIVEIVSRDEARRIARHRRDVRDETLCGCLVRSAPLGGMIRAALGPIVAHIPAGVGTTPVERGAPERSDRPRSIVVLGSGACARESIACFEGVRRVIDRATASSAVVICAELQGRQTHEVWRAIRRLELLPHVSTVADVSELRSLVLGCDAIAVPERRGALRSVYLEAMACGMPIAALRDDDVDAFVPDVTVRVVDAPQADAWAEVIEWLVADRPGAARLGASAREHVRRHHRSSDAVDVVERLLRSVVEGDALPFSTMPDAM